MAGDFSPLSIHSKIGGGGIQERFLEDRRIYHQKRKIFLQVEKEYLKTERVFGPIIYGAPISAPAPAPTPTAPATTATTETTTTGLTSSFGYFGLSR